MEQQKKHDIALMKYSAIAPVISGLPAQYKSFSEYFREVSERGILHPDGTLRHYAVSTISKWYELYSKDGFDSLRLHPPRRTLRINSPALHSPPFHGKEEDGQSGHAPL